MNSPRYGRRRVAQRRACRVGGGLPRGKRREGVGVKRCCGVIAACGGGLGGSRRGWVVRVPRVAGYLKGGVMN